MNPKYLKSFARLLLLIVVLSFCSIFFSCSSTKTDKIITTETVNKQVKKAKDSLNKLRIENYEATIASQNELITKLQTSLKEKIASNTETKTKVILKPEIDPTTGLFKESKYEETKDGKTTKSIKINGNGTVEVETNDKLTSEKEKTETSSTLNSKIDTLKETNLKLQEERHVLTSEKEELQLKLSKAVKEVHKKNSGVWLMFWIGFGCGLILSMLLTYISIKFNIFTKIKNLFT